MDGDIPKEAWIGKKVNYSFLKTFGCEAFVHINKYNRTNLEEKQGNVSLLDMVLINLAIIYMIMKITKSLRVQMSYSIKGSCKRIKWKKRNRKRKI